MRSYVLLFRWLSILTIGMIIFFSNIIFVHRITETLNIRDNLNASYQVILKPGLLELINPSEPECPYNVQYIHENETFCSSVVNLTFLVIVLSSAGNFDRRRTVRQTWGNETIYTSYGKVKVLFLLGIVNSANVQMRINKEFNLYGDIVQGAFQDTYHNLTHKSIMGFKWTTARCRNAKYVIKTDDDIVINMFKVFENNILSEAENKTHIYCHRQSNFIDRYEGSKWYVEHNKFKGLFRYPTYCGGSFVMILNEVVPYIYASMLRTPFFWIEDVVLYGIVLYNIPGLKYQTVQDKSDRQGNITAAIDCHNRLHRNCTAFIFFTETVTEVRNLWISILQDFKK